MAAFLRSLATLRFPMLVFVCVQPAIAAVQSHASAEAMLARIGVHDVSALQKGEILAYDVGEPTDETMAAGLVMHLETSPQRAISAVERGAIVDGDQDLIATGTILPAAGAAALSGFHFTPSPEDREEAEALFEAEPGSEFNLSVPEINGFKALALTLDHADEADKLQALSSQYREMLWQRLENYRHAGLNGIAPYARRGGHEVAVGAELRTFTERCPLLQFHAPALRTALLRFPEALPQDVSSEFQWVERKVQGRPTVILVHQLSHRQPHAAVIAVRDFYVGHSFDSSQWVMAILPYRNGSLVAYDHYTSTEQVSGVGKSLKHAIGRERLRTVMVSRMERLRAAAR